MSRFREALLRWLGHEPAGVEAMLTHDPMLAVTALDPSKVGRQASRGAAILDVSAWLELSGWANADAGERQRYAAWLLERREAYERQGAVR